MANILYISVHSILEHDELNLFTELGHDIFSLGAYHRVEGHYLLPRPGLVGAKNHPELEEVYLRHPNRNELPSELIDWADIIMVMHQPDIVVNNWPRIKHKKVVWRSIGQSTPGIEEMLAPLIGQGLQIVRYSPLEQHLPRYAGANAIIRFYKDPQELNNWTGHDVSVINFSQSLKGRRTFCHHDHILEMMNGFPSKIYGSGNEDLGPLNGGELSWDLMKGRLRDTRVYAYGGTWPAPYTLSFIEAMMTGIPVVSIGKNLAENLPGVERFRFFEIPEIFENGKHLFYADDITTLRAHIFQILNDYDLAKHISTHGRAKAIELFGKSTIKQQWKEYLETLK